MNSFFRFYFRKILVFIAVFTIILEACKTEYSKTKESKLRNRIKNIKHKKEDIKSTFNKTISQKNKTINSIRYQSNIQNVLVVIIHGLTSDNDFYFSKKNFKKIINCLKNKFRNMSNKKLRILFVTIDNSVNTHINIQSKIAYNKIRKYMCKKMISRDINIICIGHSAGGLVCYELYKNNLSKLNIKGILTLNTPWLGTKLSYNYAKCKNIKKPFKILLNSINVDYNYKKAGIRDVTCGSPFLKWVRKSITSCKIPIWALGGNTQYFKNCFSISPLRKIMFKTNNPEKELFGTLKHDGVVPLKSQMGISLKNIQGIYIKGNITHSIYTLKNMKRMSYGIMNTFGDLCSIDTMEKLRSIVTGISMTETSQTIKKVIEFIEIYGFKDIPTSERNYLNDSKTVS